MVVAKPKARFHKLCQSHQFNRLPDCMTLLAPVILMWLIVVPQSSLQTQFRRFLRATPTKGCGRRSCPRKVIWKICVSKREGHVASRASWRWFYLPLQGPSGTLPWWKWLRCHSIGATACHSNTFHEAESVQDPNRFATWFPRKSSNRQCRHRLRWDCPPHCCTVQPHCLLHQSMHRLRNPPVVLPNSCTAQECSGRQGHVLNKCAAQRSEHQHTLSAWTDESKDLLLEQICGTCTHIQKQSCSDVLKAYSQASVS